MQDFYGSVELIFITKAILIGLAVASIGFTLFLMVESNAQLVPLAVIITAVITRYAQDPFVAFGVGLFTYTMCTFIFSLLSLISSISR